MKPENEKLKQQVEDLTYQLTDALSECRKLKKKPQELEASFDAKVTELTNETNNFRDQNKKLVDENEALKKDLSEILEEKKAKNAERRKRKEEQLKKLQEDAQKKLDENKKKLEAKKNAAESNELVKNVMTAQETLKKYPESHAETEAKANEYIGEEVPQVAIPEVPAIDPNILDVQAIDFKQASKTSTVVVQKQTFFQVSEPMVAEKSGRRPAMNTKSLYMSLTQTKNVNDSLEIAGTCPYCWGDEKKPTCPVTSHKGKSVIMSGLYVPTSPAKERENAIEVAKSFLNKGKNEPKLKDVFDKVLSGVDLDTISNNNDELAELGKSLLELVHKKEEEGKPVKVQDLTEEDVTALFAKHINKA